MIFEIYLENMYVRSNAHTRLLLTNRGVWT